ncbi:ORF6N domain-containing protein [Bacillus sp. Fil]|uniref:ORF6N domain-containing protein n=1 Tax=Bacillus sp. Fil TaxID=3459567 RepID=UPI00403AF3A3
MRHLQIMGKQMVAGYEFTGIEGGFGEGKKAMLVKEIAEIHEKEVKHINLRINENRSRFKEGMDIIDLKVSPFDGPSLEQLGFTKQSVANSKNIYLLSERGYAKLLKILEDDTAWELYDKFVDGYFQLRAENKQDRVSVVQVDVTKETNAQARLLNAKTRQANLLLKAAETFKESLSAEAKQSLVAHATRIVAGEMLLSLPEVRKTYTEGEIGEELGVSANLIGRLANKHNLKTDEYGMKVLDKSRYSHKQIPTFRYFEHVKPILRELLG